MSEDKSKLQLIMEIAQANNKNLELIEELNEREEEIERLKKKIKQYEEPEDMTLMYMWCDEKAKDEIKRLNNIINELNVELKRYKSIVFLCEKVKDSDKECMNYGEEKDQ